MGRKYLLLICGVLFSLLIRTFFVLNGSEVGDIHTLQEMGEITLKGQNPYLLLNYNSYPPLALYLEIITLKLSYFFNIPFYILIKIWPNLADFLTSLIIFKFLIKKGVDHFSASIWSLVFLLNPISILISSAHGQIDSIPNLLVIIAAVILQLKVSKKTIYTSALLLGLASSIKPNPLVLLPIFFVFIYKKTNFLEKLVFIFFTFTPLILLLTPFLQSNFQYISEKLFNYSGSSDFGLLAPLRTHYFYRNATYDLPFIDQLLKNSKIIFLILFGFLVFIFRNSVNIIKLCLITYLLFLTVYFGISAQYLSWILPLAVLQKDKMVVAFTISGMIALLGFYLYFNPAILLVQFVTIQPYYFPFMLIYAFGNLLLWLTTFLWLVKALLPKRT